MKKFTFKIDVEVVVYGESEDEARSSFCDDPTLWGLNESDMTLVCEEIGVKPLCSAEANILGGLSADDRVTLLQEIAGDYCIDCGCRRYGARCHCMNDT